MIMNVPGNHPLSPQRTRNTRQKNPTNVKKSTGLGAGGVLQITGYYQNATIPAIWFTVFE